MKIENHTAHEKRIPSGGRSKDQEDKVLKGNKSKKEGRKNMKHYKVWTLIPGAENYVHQGIFEAESRLVAASQMVRDDAVTRESKRFATGVVFESFLDGKLVQTVLTSEVRGRMAEKRSLTDEKYRHHRPGH